MKAQASVEYIILLVILLGTMSLVLTMSISSTNQINRVHSELEAKNLLDDLVNKVNLAVMEGDGFRINITLPQEMLGSEYNVTIDSSTVIVNFMNNTYFRNALTSNISGTFEKGINTIRNNNGEILITAQ
jgi:hypothetical protein